MRFDFKTNLILILIFIICCLILSKIGDGSPPDLADRINQSISKAMLRV